MCPNRYVSLLLCFVFGLAVHGAGAEDVRRPIMTSKLATPEQVTKPVVVRDISVRGGTVSGAVVNYSGNLVREVELLIRHSWLWRDEFHPRQDDPGRAVYYTLSDEIPPGGSAQFSYRPEWPSPRRTDGRFVTTVDVVGFSQIMGAAR